MHSFGALTRYDPIQSGPARLANRTCRKATDMQALTVRPSSRLVLGFGAVLAARQGDARSD
jgi:hypothetical protein